MYAVIKTGGKQYRVEQGEALRVEKLAGEAGDKIELNEVLMLVDGDNVQVGSPVIEGASVSATVREQGRADKVKIIKFRRRKHYRRQAGHRQHYTEILINNISASTSKKSAANKATKTTEEVTTAKVSASKTSEKDDLKELPGVGPKMEEKLNNLGIFTYNEIANFSAERIEEVNAALKFKDNRIERDDWKGHAAKLAAD